MVKKKHLKKNGKTASVTLGLVVFGGETGLGGRGVSTTTTSDDASAGAERNERPGAHKYQ